jgi:hypothetical protein
MTFLYRGFCYEESAPIENEYFDEKSSSIFSRGIVIHEVLLVF